MVPPLTFAICHGPLSTLDALVEILLTAGADSQVNCASPGFRLTALHCAAGIEDKAVKKAVIQRLIPPTLANSSKL